MAKLGHIVIENPKLIQQVDFISYDKSLPNNITTPTLIIGWSVVKQLFPNQSILDKKINNDLFWTFSKNERRVEHDKDINNFYKYILTNILENKIEYHYFDIFTTSLTKMKNLIKLLNSEKNKHIYVFANSFIYLYYDKYVIGISIDDLEYMGITKEKILRKLYNNRTNQIFYNNDFVSLDIRRVINYNKIIIPYLHYIL